VHNHLEQSEMESAEWPMHTMVLECLEQFGIQSTEWSMHTVVEGNPDLVEVVESCLHVW